MYIYIYVPVREELTGGLRLRLGRRAAAAPYTYVYIYIYILLFIYLFIHLVNPARFSQVWLLGVGPIEYNI